jgi:Spy/CpxP family protein refolding chaperone
MKRFTLSVLMTVVLGLAAYTWSGAQREPGPGRPGGPGAGRGAMALLRGANLTDEQQAAIRAIRETSRTGQSGAPVESQLRRQLDAEVFAEAPDTGRITALQQQLLQAQGQRLANDIATQQKIAQVLTSEQRAKVRERLTQPPPEGRRRPAAGRRG